MCSSPSIFFPSQRVLNTVEQEITELNSASDNRFVGKTNLRGISRVCTHALPFQSRGVIEMESTCCMRHSFTLIQLQWEHLIFATLSASQRGVDSVLVCLFVKTVDFFHASHKIKTDDLSGCESGETGGTCSFKEETLCDHVIMSRVSVSHYAHQL